MPRSVSNRPNPRKRAPGRPAEPFNRFEAMLAKHPKQRDFVDTVLGAKKSLVLFAAANRCGKSVAGAYCAAKILRGRAGDHWPKPTIGAVVVPDHGQGVQVAQQLLYRGGIEHGTEPFVPEREIVSRPDIRTPVLRLKNGNEAWFLSCAQSLSSLMGRAFHWIWFDEVPPLNAYEEIVRGLIPGWPTRVFMSATLLPPQGSAAYTNWVFPTIIDPWKAGATPEVAVMTAGLLDNPAISTEEYEAQKAKYRHSELQLRIRINGELVSGAAGARAYASFNNTVNVCEGVTEMVVGHRPLALCLDFNVSPAVGVLGQYDEDRGAFLVFDEIYLDTATVAEVCDAFRAKMEELGQPHGWPAGVWLYGDASGGSRNQQTLLSNWQVVAAHLSEWCRHVKHQLAHYNPRVSERVASVNMACQGPYGRTGLFVQAGRCPNLVRDLDNVLLAANGLELRKASGNPRDPYRMLGHLSDALGYWVHYVQPSSLVIARTQRGGGACSVRVPRPSYFPGSQR